MKPQKHERERLVLLGLVELHLQLGTPIGSNTLKENGFDSMSSATIRNYFVKLENQGFLKQQHASGGRVPTSLAYQLYAEQCLDATDKFDKKKFEKKLSEETKEVVDYLQRASEEVSKASNCAVFLSMPRFDQDFIVDVKLMTLDPRRLLCVLMTDFGLVHTEVFYPETPLSQFSLKRTEEYFHFRMTGLDMPSLDPEEEEVAHTLYNEIMLRHIVGYSNFSADDVYKTGFSELLNYPEFQEASALAQGLSLFEDVTHMRQLLNETRKDGKLRYWIGSEGAQDYSVIAIPYCIQQQCVGAIAILGPTRLDYKKIFSLLRTTSDCLSKSLTKSLYRFKITYRQAEAKHLDLDSHAAYLQLEIKE